MNFCSLCNVIPLISVISITKAGAPSGASSTLTNYNCKNEMKMSLHFKEPLPTTMSHHTCFRADWRKWTVSASTNSSFLLSMTMLDMMRPSQEKNQEQSELEWMDWRCIISLAHFGLSTEWMCQSRMKSCAHMA